ncbi:MAG: hypothetical protein V7K88_14015 [Nostoc sp.]
MDWEESSLPVVTIVTTVALNINAYHFLTTTLPEKLIMKVAGENQVLTTMQILFSHLARTVSDGRRRLAIISLDPTNPPNLIGGVCQNTL